MRRITAGFLLALAVLTVGCASAPPESLFVKLEDEWVAAIQAHDESTLDRLLDDSFVDTTFRGTFRTKHDVLNSPPVAGAYHTIRLEDVAVRIYAERMAVVTGVNVLQGAEADDIVRVSFTDVFVRRSAFWRAVSAQETLQWT